jgi:hypothetical protein
LPWLQKSEQHDGPIREFQRVVMGMLTLQIDLAEHRGLVGNGVLAPRPSAWKPDLVRNSQFCSGKQANRGLDIFRCSEARCTSDKTASDQLITDLGRARPNNLLSCRGPGRRLAFACERGSLCLMFLSSNRFALVARIVRCDPSCSTSKDSLAKRYGEVGHQPSA